MLLFTLLTTGLPGLFFNAASATSAYDDLVKPVSTLRLSHSQLPNDIRDISNDYLNIMQDKCSTAHNSLQQAMQNPQNGGRWTINQVGFYDWDTGDVIDSYGLSVEIYWTVSGGDNFQIGWGSSDVSASTSSSDPDDKIYSAYIHLESNGDYTCYSNNTSEAFVVLLTDIPNIEFKQPWYSTFDYDYPTGYEGALVPDGQSIDSDGDGLNIIQEMQQQTSDGEDDTDGDGIDDLKESVWFSNRDEVFCKIDPPAANICAYPDPIVQDVYVEIDWMQDGSESYKPNSDQIEMVEDAFIAQGINFHADTSEFGGGNVLQSFESPLYFGNSTTNVDFNDYRNGYGTDPANFNPDRQTIWRYMISGYKYAEYPDSSGIAEVGGDNIFISYGLIEDDFSWSDFDTYIASTMIHEIGHNLCLSGTLKYTNQPSECIFSGIDSDAIEYEIYPSAMTYRHQGDTVDYSTGQGLVYDHDDWSAVKLEMGHFRSLYPSSGVSLKSYSTNATRTVDMNLAAPNEMTPDLSKKIHKSKESKKE